MLRFENVWKAVTPEIKTDLIRLWIDNNVLSTEDAEKRAAQAVFVIRTETGELAGVSTAARFRLKLLNENYLYEFRCFIPERHRVAGLDVKISRITFDLLEEESKKETEKTVGIFSVLENGELKKESVWRRAVWPELEMYFAGYTKKGHPLRVHYFKGVTI